MKYFGTDGFRGEANVNLNVVHAYKVGRFLGWYYGREHKARIIIGKDTRRSSYMFEDALSSGLTASGADVYLLHVTPTPSVSYVVRTEDFDCGIMISASHNPYYDNGLKVINGKGHKLEAEIEEKIEAYIDSPEDTLPMATREKIGCTVDYAIGRHRYIGYLMSLATRSFKNVRVGLDCANGSSYSVAKGVFDALGAKTYAIGMEPNGININDGCGSTHIENLQKFVKENNLDVVSRPEIDVTAIDENGVSFTAEVYTKPEVKLGEYKGLKYTKMDEEPTDEEIRQSLDLNQSKVQLQKELHKLINDNELSMRNEKDFFKDIDKKLMDTYAEFATLIFDKFEFEEFEEEADSTDLVIAPRLSELYRLCTSGAKQAEVDKVYRNIIKDNIESSFQS